MRKTKFLILCLWFSFQVSAQINQTFESEYEGQDISQEDLDILYHQNPKLSLLNIQTNEKSLVLPDFKELNILSITSDSLTQLTLPDTLLQLGLIDFQLPKLNSLNDAVLPNLYELMISASLSSFPNFYCNSSTLTLVSIKNFQKVPIDTCFSERFYNGDFELSDCMVVDEDNQEILLNLFTQDDEYPDAWSNEEDPLNNMELKDLEKKIKKTGRKLKVIRFAGRFVFAGIIFLIIKS